MPENPHGVWAVVPVKNLDNAKQRLSPILDVGQRRSLLRAMLHDVLTALTNTDCLAGVMLVTRDDAIREIADGFAVRVFTEHDNRGHTEAVTRGAEKLASESLASMLTIPADLPLVTPEDITAVVTAHAQRSPAVTIAPARDKLGSNAVLCSPPNVMPFRFGDNSFFPHLRKARELGIEPQVVERHGLGLDIDTPDDLSVFAAEPSLTRAYDYLARSGLLAALSASAETAESRQRVNHP